MENINEKFKRLDILRESIEIEQKEIDKMLISMTPYIKEPKTFNGKVKNLIKFNRRKFILLNFFNKKGKTISNYLTNLYEKYITSTIKRRKNKKHKILLEKSFNNIFKNTSVEQIKKLNGIITKNDVEDKSSEDLIISAKKYNSFKNKSPHLVDFDTIIEHNDNLNNKEFNLETIRHNSYESDAYKLKKANRKLNTKYYKDETLGQKIKRLSTD